MDKVTITLHLKNSQKTGNYWNATINGKEIIFESSRILYYANNMLNALLSFDPEEVDVVRIERASCVVKKTKKI